MTRKLAAPLAALLLGACTGTSAPPSSINISDSGVIVPTVRLSVDLRDPPGAPADPKRGHALELGLSRAEGDGTQPLAAGQRSVVFGGQTFNTPVSLRNEFEFMFLELAYRYRINVQPDQPGLEVRGGVAQGWLDMTVASPSQRATENLDTFGAIGSLGFFVPLMPKTTVQGRLTFFLSGSGSGITDATRLELHGVRTLGRNAAVRAGFVRWNVDSDRDTSSSSIKVKFSGPSLGIDIAL